MPPLVAYLRGGKRPAWEIEEELAAQFKVAATERAQIYPKSGCPIWRNDVAFAFERLIQEGKIGCDGKRRMPKGGFRGVYFLKDRGQP